MERSPGTQSSQNTFDYDDGASSDNKSNLVPQQLRIDDSMRLPDAPRERVHLPLLPYASILPHGSVFTASGPRTGPFSSRLTLNSEPYEPPTTEPIKSFNQSENEVLKVQSGFVSHCCANKPKRFATVWREMITLKA